MKLFTMVAGDSDLPMLVLLDWDLVQDRLAPHIEVMKSLSGKGNFPTTSLIEMVHRYRDPWRLDLDGIRVVYLKDCDGTELDQEIWAPLPEDFVLNEGAAPPVMLEAELHVASDHVCWWWIYVQGARSTRTPCFPWRWIEDDPPF